MKTIDLAVLIALKEEFVEFHAEIEKRSNVVRDDATGSFDYHFERTTSNGNRYRGVAAFAGEMGETNAALMAQRLSDRFRPQSFVMLGIAGSLSKDVKLGDVVAATSVDGYLQRAKASQEKVGEAVPFELSGEVYRCSADLIKFVSNLPFAHGKAFKKWQSNCSRRLKKLIPQEQLDKLIGQQHLRSEPRVEEGHIASGPVVGAAKEFKDWLRTRDRSYLAIEMEAAGLLTALHEHIEPKRTLVLRAISDLGDSAKDELDNIESGALRRYAMQNAIQLLWTLLDVEALPFHSATDHQPGAEARTGGSTSRPSHSAASEEKNYNVAVVRELIEGALSDDELNDLCQGHFPDVFNQFTTGQTKGMRIRLLVEHVSRRRQIDKLLAELERVNPVALAERREDIYSK